MINSLTKTTLILVIAALVSAIFLLGAAKLIYNLADQPHTAYLEKIGGLLIQLAMLVIIGPLIKGLLDYIASEKDRRARVRAQRMDFLRRLRDVHVAIECDRQLCNAQKHFDTYQKMCTNIMKLQFEIDEITEDLKAAPSLFTGYTNLLQAISAMGDYLREGAQEFHRRYQYISYGGRGSGFSGKLESLVWARDFLDSGPVFQERYLTNLDLSKRIIREEVFQ